MRKRRLMRATVEYFAALWVLTVLRVLPRQIAVSTARLISGIFYRFSSRLRNVGERNLAIAMPETDSLERARILRGCFDNLGRLAAEFSHLPKSSPKSLSRLVRFEGLEHFLKAREQGRGVILITSHLGAWELSAVALAASGYSMTVLVRRLDNARVEQMIDRIRTRFGNKMIDKRGAVRALLRALHKGETVGILGDLNSLHKDGIFVPFFGRQACTVTGIATLALHTGAPVVPLCIPWNEEHKCYVLKFDPPLELLRTGNHEYDILANTASWTLALEKHIRSYPEQWLWIHKRWRTRPKGEVDLYAGV
jgi:Kdo2-lipid IVA lauroyltransferase/acyltransferase